MRQLIMNVVMNGAESIDKGHGTVSVSLTAEQVGQEQLEAFQAGAGCRPGAFVRLEVTDTGRGMDDETAKRLFEPFFTTKPNGRGLGMAAVHGIVRGHDGAVQVRSQPGKGTTVTVLIPQCSELPSAVTVEATENALHVGEGKVLVAEDESNVREVVCAMLERMGYETLTAKNGQLALDKLAAEPDICAVVLDWTMPILSGHETFQAIRARWPATPVLLYSGYGKSGPTNDLLVEDWYGTLSKPFVYSEFRAAFGKVVSARSQGERSLE